MKNLVKEIVRKRNKIKDLERRINELKKYIEKVRGINPDICVLEEEEEIADLELELKRIRGEIQNG